jgi:hypothetical protein
MGVLAASIGPWRSTVEYQPIGFFQRLRVVLRLIWSLLVHPTPPSEPSPPESVTNRARWSGKPGTTPPRVESPPPLGELVRVIPIEQTQSASGIDITLLSLELYHEGFVLLGLQSAKYGEWSRENIWNAHPTFSVIDDRGNAYRWWRGSDNPKEGIYRFEDRFAPGLHPEARELTITLTEMRTTFFKEHRHVVDSGPWIFSVALT